MTAASKTKPKTKPKPKQRYFTRRTITLPPELDAEINDCIGNGKFSAFVQRSLTHELQRERIAQWLDEREVARHAKPLGREAVAFAEQAWRKRK